MASFISSVLLNTDFANGQSGIIFLAYKQILAFLEPVFYSLFRKLRIYFCMIYNCLSLSISYMSLISFFSIYYRFEKNPFFVWLFSCKMSILI
jgi:hypothetical protein